MRIGELADALNDAVHGGLSLDHMLIARPDERVVVWDFGLNAFLKEAHDAVAGTYTNGGQFRFHGHMAPEQVCGAPSRATDVWSLATIAYELLVGRTYFRTGLGDTTWDVLREPMAPVVEPEHARRRRGPPRRVRRVVPALRGARSRGALPRSDQRGARWRPPDMSSGVEVQVSYAARLGCLLTMGATLLIGLGPILIPQCPILALPALALLLSVIVIPLMFVAEKKRIPRFIDPSGITMRNGLKLPWSEYQGIRIVRERRNHTRAEVGVELLFAHGEALICYRPIKNLPQVMWIVEALKQQRKPFG
jgi:serine/threonine protein kinase